MKLGIGVNVSISKNETVVDATITHEGVVDASKAGVLSARNGLVAISGKAKSYVQDKDLVGKAKGAVSTTKEVATKAAHKVSEVSGDVAAKAMVATADGLDKVADLLNKEDADNQGDEFSMAPATVDQS